MDAPYASGTFLPKSKSGEVGYYYLLLVAYYDMMYFTPAVNYYPNLSLNVMGKGGYISGKLGSNYLCRGYAASVYVFKPSDLIGL